MKLLAREPAATLAVVQAAIALAVSFGVDLTAEQTGGILAFTAATLGWATRRKVSPYVREPEGFDADGYETTP